MIQQSVNQLLTIGGIAAGALQQSSLEQRGIEEAKTDIAKERTEMMYESVKEGLPEVGLEETEFGKEITNPRKDTKSKIQQQEREIETERATRGNGSVLSNIKASKREAEIRGRLKEIKNKIFLDYDPRFKSQPQQQPKLSYAEEQWNTAMASMQAQGITQGKIVEGVKEFKSTLKHRTSPREKNRLKAGDNR